MPWWVRNFHDGSLKMSRPYLGTMNHLSWERRPEVPAVWLAVLSTTVDGQASRGCFRHFKTLLPIVRLWLYNFRVVPYDLMTMLHAASTVSLYWQPTLEPRMARFPGQSSVSDFDVLTRQSKEIWRAVRSG